MTLNWLRELAPVEGSPLDIAEQLTDLGLEVGEVVPIGGADERIVVARVLEVRAHPDADRVRLVDVDAGDGRPLQIVCGASNMVAGDLVPLATVGTVMPGGMEIAARKMRGQMSNGMLCSARELGLGDDHSGILVLGAAGEREPTPGTTLAEALDLRPDVVFDLDVNPNRPDALCVAGIARDLAARQGVAFALPTPVPSESGAPLGGEVSVVIHDPLLCG
ncbi:MAG: phenylalanine--tRNA ligase subunit beta, partial [Actinobacteria bacterium]|nr:phenylalanine--tRNA ligase subunit beta [Actinomycetota bacterium]